MSFIDNYLSGNSAKVGLCVGVDPTPDILKNWGLNDSPESLLTYGKSVLEAVDGLVQVVKPQVAYFERFGPAGYSVLTSIIAEARERGLLVIADAKRGDIGSTVDAYAQAWLGESAPFRVDGITANPYLGFDSLEPLYRRASDSGAYVFVVVRSSNPEGTRLQNTGEHPVWKALLDDLAEWTEKNDRTTVGAVVGATVVSDLDYALSSVEDALFLAPGIGKQGASMDDLKTISTGQNRIIATASRSVSEAGPCITDLREAITTLVAN